MAYILKVRKLISVGKDYKRTLNFHDKLNIIKGDGYSGKSLVLNLIDYCLGSRKEAIDLNVQKELNEYCDECFVEISINDKVYTFVRNLKKTTNEIRIYLCEYAEHQDYSPWKKSPDEACDFIVQELGIELHVISKRKAHSTELTTEKLSFRDLMRFTYFKQGELGNDTFMGFKEYASLKKKNQEVFRIVNDLIIPDLLDIEERLRQLNNEFANNQKNYDALHQYLENRDALNLLQLDTEKQNLINRIQTEQTEKETLIKSTVNDNRYSDTVKNLKEDYKLLEDSALNAENESSIVTVSIFNKRSLIKDYENELQRLQSTIEVMKTIKISEHDYQCPLCNNIVKNQADESTPVKDIEQAYAEIEKKVKSLQKVIDVESEKLHDIEKEITKLRDKQRIILNAMNEFTQNIESGVIAEVEAINSIIKDLQGEKNKISSLIDMNNDLDKYAGSLERIKKDIKKAENQKDSLNELKAKEDFLLDNMSLDYRKVMNKFNFDSSVDHTYIDKNDFMPYYSGQNFIKHTSGCLRLCMQMAYIMAIARACKTDFDKFKHPRLFMFDTVSNNIGTNKDDKESLDPKTYAELYNCLAELSTWNQLFVIDNTPPSITGEHKLFEFHRNGLRGFIDERQNEYRSNKDTISTD